MIYRLIVVREVEDEAQSIYDWIANRSLEGAVRWFEAFVKAVYSLKRNPERCGMAAESPFRGKSLRQLIFRAPSGQRYRLLFTIIGDDVRVLHLRGPGQDLLSED